MHRMYKQALLLAAIGAFAIPGLAAETYKVTAEIRHADTVVDTPTLVVRDGVPGQVSINGESGYRLRVTVTSPEEGELDVAAKVDTHKGSVSTSVTTGIGKPMALSAGELGLSITVEPAGS
ncbi:hypothetical protein [Marilutibacter aestuarii]|uniref:Uncharacterized protein n=1 Tax=Marilutibacter aestuarii TaxID=1706195 RepID=A0A508ARB2_9GAMM|nr:hypothetical protein [Lysobacter aestuarii]TQD51483.1 hypothetical protein FKV25_00990 [Lysobacter aestuarii]